jgi:hypothetical protein
MDQSWDFWDFRQADPSLYGHSKNAFLMNFLFPRVMFSKVAVESSSVLSVLRRDDDLLAFYT